ncbi:MAG TPA: hypothetical protein VHG10_13620 [Glycomyces sp.]|nr:hypothetical protein [Glycomyces sp.]
MRSTTPLVGAAVAVLALTGCTGEDPETGPDAAAATDVAEATSTQEPTAEPEPEVFRESMGLFRATDPATGELVELLDTGQVALDLTLHVEGESVETTDPVGGAADSVNLWFFFDGGEDNFLTLNVPEAALAIGDIEAQDALSTLRGAFSVEASSGSDVDYVLTLTGDVPEAESADEQRCGEEDALISDAETLADDPAAYATVRERWDDSPRLWWAVKATAHSLAEYGDMSDSMATACAIYW